MNEKEVFQKLLSSLCAGIEQPAYKGDGRPALPLSDVIFSGALKVYTLFSSDRVTSDVRSAQRDGLIEVVPHPNTILRVLRMPETVPVLKRLVEESAMPLRMIEVDFAADGTGIGTKNYVRWFDTKHGKERREKVWLKLHIMVGVKTLVITGVEVTPGNKNDSPELPSLIAQTARNFNMREVSADLGYYGKKNLHAIVNAGAAPYIPFKPTSRPDRKDQLWTRNLAYFVANQPEWMAHYHKRSLSESLFSSVKRVLGSTVKAKSFDGQVSEVYLKVLAHNLRMLVHAMYELGIDPTFWNDGPVLPPSLPPSNENGGHR